MFATFCDFEAHKLLTFSPFVYWRNKNTDGGGGQILSYVPPKAARTVVGASLRAPTGLEREFRVVGRDCLKCEWKKKQFRCFTQVILSQKKFFLTDFFFPPPNAKKPFRVSSIWNFYNHLTVYSFQIGHIDGDPSRKGAFPVSFVHFIADWIATEEKHFF